MTLTTISAPSSASSKLLVACTASGMASPGKNRSFTRRSRMLSHTSGSCAHKRTRCVCLRPSTMEIAVPHAPAPMTAISLTSNSLSSPTILRADQQAPDVVFVPNDNQQGRSHDQQQDWSVRALGRVEPPHEERKCRRRDHAAQRDVTCERNNNHEHDESDDNGAWRQCRKGPYGRGHSFAPFEAQPDRKHVAYDGAESGESGQLEC